MPISSFAGAHGVLSGGRQTRRVRGLTIIEVLVAIAIIAVMVASFLPQVTKARAVANTALCAANQHMIFNGLMGYQGDFIMQPNLSASRSDDGVTAPNDPQSGMCIWGQSYTNPGVNESMAHGQLLQGSYISLATLFCPENNDTGELSENPERRWFRRQFLYGIPYTAGGTAGDNFIKAYPGGDGLGLPQPTTASLYYRSHYMYRSGDWSYTNSMAATTGTASSSLSFLKSDAANYNNKIILMDMRHWYHERAGSGLNTTWGDGSTNFKRNSGVNGGVIPSAWRTYGGMNYAASGTSSQRVAMSWLGCAYFDKWEQAGR